MANKYTDKDKLIAELKDRISIYPGCVRRAIENASEDPDVVKVVRCGKCKHYLDDTDYCKANNKKYCDFDKVIKPENHYCAWGDEK